jgi:hypothetical protein
VKRKPGHWFSIQMLTRTPFFLLCPPEGGGSEKDASRISSNEEQLVDELNIAFVNGWSADGVRLAISLVGSCLREAGVVLPLLSHPCQLMRSPQGRAVHCGGSTRSLLGDGGSRETCHPQGNAWIEPTMMLNVSIGPSRLCCASMSRFA